MRVLVYTLPEKGHILPLLGPARALEADGHEVIWACTTDIREELEPWGVHRVLVPIGGQGEQDELRARLLGR